MFLKTIETNSKSCKEENLLKIIILNLSIIKTNVSIFYFFLIGNENHPLYKSRTVSEYDFEVRRNISKYMFQFKP
jgi:hypothetical protein